MAKLVEFTNYNGHPVTININKFFAAQPVENDDTITGETKIYVGPGDRDYFRVRDSYDNVLRILEEHINE